MARKEEREKEEEEEKRRDMESLLLFSLSLFLRGISAIKAKPRTAYKIRLGPARSLAYYTVLGRAGGYALSSAVMVVSLSLAGVCFFLFSFPYYPAYNFRGTFIRVCMSVYVYAICLCGEREFFWRRKSRGCALYRYFPAAAAAVAALGFTIDRG